MYKRLHTRTHAYIAHSLVEEVYVLVRACVPVCDVGLQMVNPVWWRGPPDITRHLNHYRLEL